MSSRRGSTLLPKTPFVDVDKIGRGWFKDDDVLSPPTTHYVVNAFRARADCRVVIRNVDCLYLASNMRFAGPYDAPFGVLRLAWPLVV